MESILVRRDQFNITPQGIVHKPTDAAFTPNPGDPYTGIHRLGQLGNETSKGSGFQDRRRSSDDARALGRIRRQQLQSSRSGAPLS